MNCRKNTPGNPCCTPDTCTCNTECNPYLATSYTITTLGHSITLNRHATERCYYQGDTCWNEAVEETNAWVEEIQSWFSFTYNYTECPSTCCFDEEHDLVRIQTAIKLSQKRYRQEHHDLYGSIYPVDIANNPISSGRCTTKLRIKVTHWIGVVYFYGGAITTWTRWRKDTITCSDPIFIVVGGWNSGTEPTMPTIQIPPCFTRFVGITPFSTFFNNCDIPIGPSVTNSCIWPASIATTIRKLTCNSYNACIHATVDAYIPDDLALRKDCSAYYPGCWLQVVAGGFGNVNPYDYTPGPDVLFGYRSYDYYSDVFDCNAVPSGTVILTRDPNSSIAATDTTTTFRGQTFHSTWPTIPATLSILI